MGKKIRVLDLYCGAGGAAKGIKQAFPNADIIGFDMSLNVGEVYPYDFRWLNIKVIKNCYPGLLRSADFIWASPPCQAYAYASKGARNKGKEYPDMVEFTRDLLLETGKPFVMENVCTAPLRKDLMLCGEMFGIKVIRHRIFEIHGFECKQPKHIKHKGTVKKGFYVTVAGHGGDGKASLKAWQDAMQIDWIKDKHQLAQAVPPAYSKYIFTQYMRNFKGD